jgi:uncharacterized protein with von Willebrand factor type A (vWA) domain
MIAALARFVEALRAEDVAVSPAEILDAARALDVVGLSRRDGVRVALKATLAKDRRSAETFDRLFDRFFAAPAVRGRARGEGRGATQGERPRPGEGDRPAPARWKPKDRDIERPRRKSTPPAGDPVESKRRRVELSTILDRARRGGERAEGRLRRARLRPSSPETSELRRRDLARRMTTDEEREIAREVPRVVSALKLRVSRRRVEASAGRPWLRRALRRNLRHGGVPFVIPYRAPKRKSSRVVLLVDVSFSVARASGLFLLMASSFLELGRRARVLAFVDRPVDATAAVAAWARGSRRGPVPETRRRRTRGGSRTGDGIRLGDASFADVLDGLPDLNLEAPSDYGTAFHALRRSKLGPRGRDTILVVLGDGRTNKFDPLPWAFDEVARGCRAVLWLVPEPRSRWDTADSALRHYLASVDLVVEAMDLDGLARGLGELVRAL